MATRTTLSSVSSWIGVWVLSLSTAAYAQEHSDHALPPPAETDGCVWHTDANVFFGINHQDRKFLDFTVWESQNWIMAGGERQVGSGRLRVNGMVSLEPFTLRALGSPQVFQTGETYQGGALIDYQHPHDFLMALGADFRVPVRQAAVIVAVDLVGTPSLGPTPFMHRASAEFNPQAPLSHHHLDATHITPGVVRAGIEMKGWTVDGSWFRGREPDEDRLDVDLGALDSYALRMTWSRASWTAQVSGGWLTAPEFVTPFDAQKITASVAYARNGVAWFAGFGQKREIHGNLEAYIFEASWRARPRDTLYTRVESVAKDILDVGFHPVGSFHPHRQSQVGAATLGYARDIVQTSAGKFSVGADITGYVVPQNLKEPYGSPLSLHAYVRYRLRPSIVDHQH